MDWNLIIKEWAAKDLKIVILIFGVFFAFYLFFFMNFNSEFLIEMTGMFSALIETTVPIP